MSRLQLNPSCMLSFNPLKVRCMRLVILVGAHLTSARIYAVTLSLHQFVACYIRARQSFRRSCWQFV